MIRGLMLLILLSAVPAMASDLYYLAPGTGKFGETLYDMPRSIALARCYGRYAAAMHDGRTGLDAKLGRIGTALRTAAKADRGLRLKLAQFRPEEMDKETGLTISTGAPEQLYAFYRRGYNDLQKDKDAPLAACDVLLNDLNASRNIGPPIEPAIGGQPMVLALTYCYGQWRFVRSRIEPRDALEPFSPDGDAGGFARDGAQLEEILIEVAKRDRGLALSLPAYPHGLTLPAALWDAYVAGWSSVSTGRPDFTEMMASDYRGLRVSCQELAAVAVGR